MPSANQDNTCMENEMSKNFTDSKDHVRDVTQNVRPAIQRGLSVLLRKFKPKKKSPLHQASIPRQISVPLGRGSSEDMKSESPIPRSQSSRTGVSITDEDNNNPFSAIKIYDAEPYELKRAPSRMKRSLSFLSGISRSNSLAIKEEADTMLQEFKRNVPMLFEDDPLDALVHGNEKPMKPFSSWKEQACVLQNQDLFDALTPKEIEIQELQWVIYQNEKSYVERMQYLIKNIIPWLRNYDFMSKSEIELLRQLSHTIHSSHANAVKKLKKRYEASDYFVNGIGDLLLNLVRDVSWLYVDYLSEPCLYFGKLLKDGYARRAIRTYHEEFYKDLINLRLMPQKHLERYMTYFSSMENCVPSVHSDLPRYSAMVNGLKHLDLQTKMLRKLKKSEDDLINLIESIDNKAVASNLADQLLPSNDIYTCIFTEKYLDICTDYLLHAKTEFREVQNTGFLEVETPTLFPKTFTVYLHAQYMMIVTKKIELVPIDKKIMERDEVLEKNARIPSRRRGKEKVTKINLLHDVAIPITQISALDLQDCAKARNVIEFKITWPVSFLLVLYTKTSKEKDDFLMKFNALKVPRKREFKDDVLNVLNVTRNNNTLEENGNAIYRIFRESCPNALTFKLKPSNILNDCTIVARIPCRQFTMGRDCLWKMNYNCYLRILGNHSNNKVEFRVTRRVRKTDNDTANSTPASLATAVNAILEDDSPLTTDLFVDSSWEIDRMQGDIRAIVISRNVIEDGISERKTFAYRFREEYMAKRVIIAIKSELERLAIFQKAVQETATETEVPPTLSKADAFNQAVKDDLTIFYNFFDSSETFHPTLPDHVKKMIQIGWHNSKEVEPYYDFNGMTVDESSSDVLYRVIFMAYQTRLYTYDMEEGAWSSMEPGTLYVMEKKFFKETNPNERVLVSSFAIAYDKTPFYHSSSATVAAEENVYFVTIQDVPYIPKVSTYHSAVNIVRNNSGDIYNAVILFNLEETARSFDSMKYIRDQLYYAARNRALDAIEIESEKADSESFYVKSTAPSLNSVAVSPGHVEVQENIETDDGENCISQENKDPIISSVNQFIDDGANEKCNNDSIIVTQAMKQSEGEVSDVDEEETVRASNHAISKSDSNDTLHGIREEKSGSRDEMAFMDEVDTGAGVDYPILNTQEKVIHDGPEIVNEASNLDDLRKLSFTTNESISFENLFDNQGQPRNHAAFALLCARKGMKPNDTATVKRGPSYFTASKIELDTNSIDSVLADECITPTGSRIGND